MYEVSNVKTMDAWMEDMFQEHTSKVGELMLKKPTKASLHYPFMYLALYYNTIGGFHGEAEC